MAKKKEITLTGIEILGPKPLSPLNTLKLSFSDKTSIGIMITTPQKMELMKKGVQAEDNELLDGGKEAFNGA